MVENVRVRLGKGEGGKEKEREKGMVRLGELASVVLRGRNVAILVGEKDVSVFREMGFGSWVFGIMLRR